MTWPASTSGVSSRTSATPHASLAVLVADVQGERCGHLLPQGGAAVDNGPPILVSAASNRTISVALGAGIRVPWMSQLLSMVSRHSLFDLFRLVTWMKSSRYASHHGFPPRRRWRARCCRLHPSSMAKQPGVLPAKARLRSTSSPALRQLRLISATASAASR